MVAHKNSAVKRRKTKPKAFLDTSVCVSVANGKIPPAEWKAVWKFVANRFNYAISAMTLGEIMVGIARGDSEHFEENRNALRVMYQTHKRSFLRMPGRFVLEKVLNEDRRNPGLEPPDFEIQIRVALAAVSKDELERGRVVLRDSPGIVRGIDLRAIDESIRRGKEHFARRLEQLREGILEVPRPELSVRLWLNELGKDATDEECSKVTAALDAAYRHEQTLYNLAKRGNYDFSRHGSDWIDGQQLFYLCDPTIHFIARDGGIKAWTAGSNQADRIVPYDELRDLALRASSL
jgi:hypothetical protein